MPSRRAVGRMAPPSLLAATCVFTTVVAWASAFPLIRMGLESLDPLPLAAARFGVAALIALVWLAVARPKLPNPKDGARFLACGAVGITLYNALLNSGQQTVSAGAASFIINAAPIITALLAWRLLGERFGFFGWLGSAVAFAGVAIIALSQPGALRIGAGASLVFGAAVCQAGYFILQRPLVPHYGALACTAYTIVGGALLLVPWLPTALGELGATKNGVGWWPVVSLAVLPSAIGYAAWTKALGHYGASHAANFLYLVPPTTLLIAFIIADEVPALATLLGGMVAIVGVAIVNLRSRLETWPIRRRVELLD